MGEELEGITELVYAGTWDVKSVTAVIVSYQDHVPSVASVWFPC